MVKSHFLPFIYTLNNILKMYYKLSDYAKKFNVTYRTAWNRFKKNLIDGAFKDELGNILIPIKGLDTNKYTKVALYARVSSNDAKDNLDIQMNRLRDFATSNGFIIVYEAKEIASGMNDSRPKLGKLLSYENWDVLIVENKDRLTRFGFNYIETLLNTKNKEILVVNKTEDNEKKDLIEDLVSIIYSFSARIYGLRKGRTVSNEIKNKLK